MGLIDLAWWTPVAANPPALLQLTPLERVRSTGTDLVTMDDSTFDDLPVRGFLRHTSSVISVETVSSRLVLNTTGLDSIGQMTLDNLPSTRNLGVTHQS